MRPFLGSLPRVLEGELGEAGLKYEEIKSDPVQPVRKLAAFLGAPFSEEEESSGVPHEVVRLCSFETLTSLRVNQVGGVDHRDYYMPYSAFFRKGVTGD